MKKLSKLFLLISLFLVVFCGVCQAKENEFIVIKKIEYQNNNSIKLKEGFVEIMLGQLNFTQYAKDEYIKVTPNPTRIEKDDLGNLYAYFDVTGMLPKETLLITIERKMKVSDFATEEPILARSNGSVTEDNKIYVEAAEKIESDNQEIIDKANELTADLTTDYRKARAFFEFVNTKLTYDTSSNYANKGALSALKNNKGVCEEFACLFVALCRAKEIPARVVAGYKVEEKDKQLELIDHAWAEIYLDDYGWLPVETTIIYTINGERLPYWNSFCALNEANHIPTEIYYISEDRANRRYQYVTEVSSSFKQTLYANENIIAPQQNQFKDITYYEWASDYIQELFEDGVVKGYSDEEYGPERNISRIEFMAMLARCLDYMHINTVDKARIYYYPSYSQEHWSKPEYDFLMKCFEFYAPSTDKLSMGYERLSSIFGDNADLERAITRGEAVALMDLFMEDASSWNAFRDVPITYKFANSIAKAYSSGIIEGYPDGTFRPNNTITRAEMACVLGRYIITHSHRIEP